MIEENDMVSGGITISVIKYKAVYGLKKNLDLYQSRANIDRGEPDRLGWGRQHSSRLAGNSLYTPAKIFSLQYVFTKCHVFSLPS